MQLKYRDQGSRRNWLGSRNRWLHLSLLVHKRASQDLIRTAECLATRLAAAEQALEKLRGTEDALERALTVERDRVQELEKLNRRLIRGAGWNLSFVRITSNNNSSPKMTNLARFRLSFFFWQTFVEFLRIVQ